MLSMVPYGTLGFSAEDALNIGQQALKVGKDVIDAVQTGCEVLQPQGGTSKSVCDTVNPPPVPPTPGSRALVDLTVYQQRMAQGPGGGGGVATGTYPAGSLARLNTDTGRWSIYVPMSGVLAGTPFGRALGQDDSDVEPPPPPNTVKKGDEPAQPPGTVNAGTEHKKRWYKKPLVIGGVVVGTLVLAGGAWLLLRR